MTRHTKIVATLGPASTVPAILEALDAVGLPTLLGLPAFAHIDHDLVATLLDEFGRFADEVIAEADRRAPGKPIVCASGLSPSGPVHLGNQRELMTWPRPPQVGQLTVREPGSAPLPSHLTQVSSLRSSISFSTPKAASSRVICML